MRCLRVCISLDERPRPTSLGPDRTAYPGLMAHYDQMMARDAVKKTIAIESSIGYEFPR